MRPIPWLPGTKAVILDLVSLVSALKNVPEATPS